MISETEHDEDPAAQRERIHGALERLRGARIALIAPAGGLSDTRIDNVLRLFEQAGITALPGAHVHDHHRYLAGTAAARCRDLHTAFETPDIDAVWCLRGGYGSAHLIETIDWDRLPDDVALIGHSDITALAAAFVAHGKSAIHGPMATDLLRTFARADEREAQRRSVVSIADRLAHRPHRMRLQHVAGPGQSQSGHLWGGNLTVLASMADMNHQPPGDTPLFLLLEDVGEAGFRLERCFHQISRAPWFARVRAIALGDFHQCVFEPAGLRLSDIVRDHIDESTVDLYTGAPMGHAAANQAWRYASRYQLAPSHESDASWQLSSSDQDV